MQRSNLPPFTNFNLPSPCFSGGLDEIEHCPNQAGSYLVWLHLDTITAIEKPDPRQLEPGWYCYAGSAKGPGGLRARLHRHLRKDKTQRWHIDQLSSKAQILHAWAWHTLSECTLIHTLHAQGLSHPSPGFGSSDCRSCISHLLVWTE